MNARIHWLTTTYCALLCGGFLAGPTAAQEFAGSSVHGAGNVVIKRLPDTMRVQVAIIGKGTNLKEAVAALKTRVDAARKQVEALGADKDSITVDAARVFEQQNDQRRQMEMMMAQRMRGGGKKNAKNKTSPPVMLSSQLTASWKLDAKDAEDLLLKSHPLQEKIKSADLGGSKEAENLTPEQEELLEEAETQGYSPYDDGSQQKPGEPMFYFVSRISEDERDQALADAFQKAKTDAARLAKSAGAKLGRLRSVQDTNYGVGMDEDYYDGSYNYNSRAYRAMQFVRNQQSRGDEKLEAIGAEPGQVKFAVNVTAAFDLEP
jgi:uncharacterized protein YggE